MAQPETGFSDGSALRREVIAFLSDRNCSATAAHCLAVGAQARSLAMRWGEDPNRAETAGWLHDVSAVIPNGERLAAARESDLEILPEEELVPMLLHQKLSAVLARQIFGVKDTMLLSAIGCHTTLKPAASRLDQIVFVSDKIAWDQPGDPPYLASMLSALDESLEAACLVYLEYVWQRREQLPVLHPWAAAARLDFMDRCASFRIQS